MVSQTKLIVQTQVTQGYNSEIEMHGANKFLIIFYQTMSNIFF